MAKGQLQKLDRFGPDRFDSALRSVLQPGERVLWKGRPRRRFDFSGFALWIFALPWTAFSLFWTFTAWRMTRIDSADGDAFTVMSYLFPLFGVPFILIGLAMMAAPVLAITLPGRTLHAVTDRRVLRLVAGRLSTLRSIPGGTIATVTAKPRPDGSGTLVLELHKTFTLKHGATQRSAQSVRSVIRAVPNVRAAARAVERARIAPAV